MFSVQKKLLLVAIFFLAVNTASKNLYCAKQAVAPIANVQSKTNGCLIIGGTCKQDSVASFYPLFLNNNLDADRYQYLKHTIDLDVDYLNNAEDADDSEVQLHTTIRHKSYWGNAADSFRTGSSDVLSSSGAKISSHSHDASKPPIWIKDLWLKTRLDKICKKNLGQNNSITFTSGFMPFQLGRGIALGSGYGTGKDYLAVYNRINDYNAPGLLLTTKLFDGRMTCDLYWALIESKSSSPKLTLSSAREKILGYRLKPWAGSGNDDQLIALQLGYEVKDILVRDRKASYKVYDYVMYNSAPAKTIQVSADCDSDLITLGAGFEASICRLELGLETAFNFGQGNLYNIDRNSKVTKTDDAGNVVDRYSHIERDNAGTWVPAVVTKDLATELSSNGHQQNLEQFTVGADTYRSKNNRIRPAFTNHFRGWMMVSDMAINFKNSFGIIKPALSCGIVSGDQDPNSVEKDKTYKGFIGLQECYSGVRVKSVIMLDDRNVKRPMTIVEGDRLDKPNKSSDGSFTDLRFLGAGLHLKPERWADNKFHVDFNLLGFWKDFQSKAVAFDINNNPVLSSKDARSYLGTEINMIAKFEIMKNLTFAFTAALMKPGSYYKDIAGARINGDAMSRFEEADLAQLDTKAYSIGSSTTYFLSTNLTYKF